jgi:hypothetical protein
MSADAEGVDPDRINESTRESVEKLQSLVDELRVVEQHEKNVLADDEPPLFWPA